MSFTDSSEKDNDSIIISIAIPRRDLRTGCSQLSLEYDTAYLSQLYYYITQYRTCQGREEYFDILTKELPL